MNWRLPLVCYVQGIMIGLLAGYLWGALHTTIVIEPTVAVNDERH